MNARVLESKYQEKKEQFHNYINTIKRSIAPDIYNVINVTLIKNPYNTNFPKIFFLEENKKENKSYLFIKSTIKFYLKQFYLFFSYLIAFLLYKVFYKKKRINLDSFICIDVFFLVDNIIKDESFNENYFKGIYNILDKKSINYVFLPRLYAGNKNPLKLIKFFRLINKDKRNFLFEFELLSFVNLTSILSMILVYPFKTLRLRQNNKAFDIELIRDIEKQSFESFSRYIFGKNMASLKGFDTIYSWSEFQVLERSFNYSIRTNNQNININACQFYLNYETYFNSYVDDLDFDILSSPHKVLVNGKYYLKDRDKVAYEMGVSLRYGELFNFKVKGIEEGKDILLLGSYIEQDTRYMLKNLDNFNNVLFKNHPAVNIQKLGTLKQNITIVEKNIYKLFQDSDVVIGTASGTLVEAVACGLSVIVMASQENLTANPLVTYGKGIIWDLAFSKDDVRKVYNKLLKYREENTNEIQKIALWYKENFFIEPTEENMVKVFALEKKEENR